MHGGDAGNATSTAERPKDSASGRSGFKFGCSDGAAEERRQCTGDEQEHQAVQPQSAWDSKSSVMMTPIRGMVYDGGFSEPFLGNTLNEKQ